MAVMQIAAKTLPLRVGAMQDDRVEDLDVWEQAFAPTPNGGANSQKEIAPTPKKEELSGFRLEEKWKQNADKTWRGYFVKRWKGMVRNGPTAGQIGKLMEHVKGSRILDRTEPKRTRGGKPPRQQDVGAMQWQTL